MYQWSCFWWNHGGLEHQWWWHSIWWFRISRVKCRWWYHVHVQPSICPRPRHIWMNLCPSTESERKKMDVFDWGSSEKNNTYFSCFLFEFFDGTFVDTTTFVDQMTSWCWFTRVDVTNDDNVNMNFFFSHCIGSLSDVSKTDGQKCDLKQMKQLSV